MEPAVSGPLSGVPSVDIGDEQVGSLARAWEGSHPLSVRPRAQQPAGDDDKDLGAGGDIRGRPPDDPPRGRFEEGGGDAEQVGPGVCRADGRGGYRAVPPSRGVSPLGEQRVRPRNGRFLQQRTPLLSSAQGYVGRRSGLGAGAVLRGEPCRPARTPGTSLVSAAWPSPTCAGRLAGAMTRATRGTHGSRRGGTRPWRSERNPTRTPAARGRGGPPRHRPAAAPNSRIPGSQ